MYYYIKGTSSKVVHLSDCRHVHNLEIDRLVAFENVVQAEEYGYRVCKHCSGLKPYLKLEKKQIEKLCKESGISFHNRGSHFHIDTIIGEWIIIFDEKHQRLALFHKNAYDRGTYCLIPDYHSQNFYANSMNKMLAYIIKHDDYRQKCPVHISKKKKNHPKGSHGWNAAQKREKQRNKRKAIRNVLTLIENLEWKSCG